MIIPMLGASISASPAPLHRKDKILFGIQSIRVITFRKLMFTRIYHICAYMDLVLLCLFSYSYSVVEKGLLMPIRDLASKLSLSGVEYDNELDRRTISGILSSYPDMCVHNF